MKALLLSLIIMVLFLAFPITGKAVDDSLVLFFSFEEGKGDTTQDKSGHDNTGKLEESPKWGKGKYGGGILFGDGSYMNMGDSETLDGMSELTVEFWLYVNQMNNANLIAKNDWNSSFHSHLYTGDMIYWGNSVSDRINTPGGTVVVEEWAHFTLQFDGTDKMWRIFKNGEEVVSGPATIEEIPDTDVDFTMGGPELGGGTLDGILDEFAIYNRALSADEIKQDMNGISTAVKPIGRLATTWAGIKH